MHWYQAGMLRVWCVIRFARQPPPRMLSLSSTLVPLHFFIHPVSIGSCGTRLHVTMWRFEGLEPSARHARSNDLRANTSSSFGTAMTSGTFEPKRRRRDATQAIPGVRLTAFFVAPVMKTHLLARAGGAPPMGVYGPLSSRDQ